MSVTKAVKEHIDGAVPGSFFRAEDLPGPRGAVDTALWRLHSRVPIVRIRRGLYWKGVESQFGPGRPRAIDAAIEAVDRPGTGLSGWSASNALGISTQVPPVVEVAVVGPTPTAMRNAKYRSRRNLERINLNRLEIAILEALRDFPKYVEVPWDEVVQRLDSLRAKGLIDLNRIEKASARESSPLVRDLVHRLVSELHIE